MSHPPARLTLAKLVRFIIGLSIEIARRRKWGTCRIVYQDGQIEGVSFDETWKADSQLPQFQHPEMSATIAAVAQQR